MHTIWRNRGFGLFWRCDYEYKLSSFMTLTNKTYEMCPYTSGDLMSQLLCQTRQEYLHTIVLVFKSEICPAIKFIPLKTLLLMKRSFNPKILEARRSCRSMSILILNVLSQDFANCHARTRTMQYHYSVPRATV
jgi:hypothetical protein